MIQNVEWKGREMRSLRGTYMHMKSGLWESWHSCYTLENEQNVIYSFTPLPIHSFTQGMFIVCHYVPSEQKDKVRFSLTFWQTQNSKHNKCYTLFSKAGIIKRGKGIRSVKVGKSAVISSAVLEALTVVNNLIQLIIVNSVSSQAFLSIS